MPRKGKATRRDESDGPTRGKGKRPPALKFDAARKAKFLGHLRELGTVTSAAHASGITRKTAYEHREADEEFAAAWDEALSLYADRLEQEAYRRAVVGVDDPVFYQGEECGVIRRYSDSLLQQMLKAKRPAEYRERVTADVNANVRGAVMVVPQTPVSEEAWLEAATTTAAKDDE